MAKISLLPLLSLFLACAEIAEEDGVWVLTESNFEEALKLQPSLLVEFYSPWCGNCEKLAPVYAKAAKKLAEHDPPIKIGKIDATKNGDLAGKYRLGGYPSLKYISNDEARDYTGEKTEEAIYSYVIKKNKPSLTVLEAGCNLEEILSENKISVFYFGETGSQDFEVFEKVSKAIDEASFFTTSSSEIAQKFNAGEGKVILLKNSEEKWTEFSGKVEFAKLKKWVGVNSRGPVLDFNENAISFIFRESNPVIFLFSENYEEFRSDFERLASENKGKILFCQGELFSADHGRLAQFLGLTKDSQPTAVILDASKGLLKYRLSGKPSYASMSQFLADWLDGSISRYLKSQDVPEESHEKNVRVVVSRNFKEVVFDSEKDVLVEFYAPWCGACQTLAPDYERLATDLKDVKTLVIAKIDFTENEVEGEVIGGFPTLKFYPAKNKEAVEFKGERNYETLLEFIKQNSHFEILSVKTDL